MLWVFGSALGLPFLFFAIIVAWVIIEDRLYRFLQDWRPRWALRWMTRGRLAVSSPRETRERCQELGRRLETPVGAELWRELDEFGGIAALRLVVQRTPPGAIPRCMERIEARYQKGEDPYGCRTDVSMAVRVALTDLDEKQWAALIESGIVARWLSEADNHQRRLLMRAVGGGQDVGLGLPRPSEHLKIRYPPRREPFHEVPPHYPY
mgnify:CR=1 FL=1